MSDVTSPKGQTLLGYLPSYYEEINEFLILAQTEGVEFDDILAAREEAFVQHFVDTATWGLARWEKELGITPFAGQPYDQRRSVIRSKTRGTGTVTISLIKSIAEAYANGDVTVTEYNTNLSSDADIGTTAGLAAIAGGVIRVVAGLTYTLSFNRSATNQNFGIRLRFRDKNNALITTASVSGWTFYSGYTAYYHHAINGYNAYTFSVPAGAETVQIIHAIEASNTLNYVKQIQLERGAIATSYESRKSYTVGIKFVSTLGIPPNLSDLEEAIRDALPAHLAVNYVFTYVTYGTLEGYGVTYGEIESAGLTFGELDTWGGP